MNEDDELVIAKIEFVIPRGEDNDFAIRAAINSNELVVLYAQMGGYSKEKLQKIFKRHADEISAELGGELNEKIN